MMYTRDTLEKVTAKAHEASRAGALRHAPHRRPEDECAFQTAVAAHREALDNDDVSEVRLTMP